MESLHYEDSINQNLSYARKHKQIEEHENVVDAESIMAMPR